MRRRRGLSRRFGSVVKRKNHNGVPTCLLARYPNPKEPGKRVVRRFPLGAEALAYAWLDGEEGFVRDYERGLSDWVPPEERERVVKLAREDFAVYAEDFLDSYRTVDGGRLRDSTMRLKRSDMALLVKAFGGMPVSEIGRSDVGAWLDDGVSSPYTRRRCYQLLRAMMSRLVEDGVIASSPCVFPVPRLPESRQAMIPAATRGELALIYDAMPDDTAVAVYLGAVCGLRIGEVCGLRVGDVDLARRVLHVRHAVMRSLSGEWVLKEPKTAASAGDMPISEGLAAMLEAHIKAHCDGGGDAMLLSGARTGGILPPSTLRGQFDRARRAAGRPDLHFHTLRATAITAAAQSGASPKEAQRYGRHADARISLELYQRATEDGGRRVAEAVFDSLVQTSRDRARVEAELARARERLEAARRDVERLEKELSSLG